VICLKPLLDGRQRFTAAGRLPFGHQNRELSPYRHELERGARAVQITPDLVVHGVLDAHPSDPQNTNLAADFINSVVHGLVAPRKSLQGRP